MNEELLQYIWQYQHYDKQCLLFENGSKFQIIHPGRNHINHRELFEEAKIKIEGTLWIGKIAVNLRTSDLFKSDKLSDRNYDKVIMHVVWVNDVANMDLREPVFVLSSRMTLNALEKIQYRLNIEGLGNWIKQGGNFDGINYAQAVNNKQKLQKNKEREPKTDICRDIQESSTSSNELKVISHLHEVVMGIKAVPSLLQGQVRSIKTITWSRQTENYQVEYGGYFKHVPKILLLGNWLADAGFACNERVQVIPLKSMLIIIPENGKV